MKNLFELDSEDAEDYENDYLESPDLEKELENQEVNSEDSVNAVDDEFHDNDDFFSSALRGDVAIILADLERQLASGRFPHGILLAGQKGIGKATMALELAGKLLSSGKISADKNLRTRLISGSHSDLLIIAPLYDEKKEELAREISAEQTRKISEFLSLTAGEGAWRVVIIDDAETMSLTAANALLKILEEPPPQAVLILVCHQQGRLLATIRSRCRVIKVAPLSADDFTVIANRLLPEATKEQIAQLGLISDNSPGIAAELYNSGALDLLVRMRLVFSGLPVAQNSHFQHSHLQHSDIQDSQIMMTHILEIAEELSGAKQHNNFQLFTRLALYLIREKSLDDLKNAEYWAIKWQETSEQLAIVQSRHLDYKSAIISFFHSFSFTRDIGT